MRIQTLHDALRGFAQTQINRGQASNKTLCAKTGLKPSTIANFIQGRRNLSVASLSAMVQVLGFEAVVVPLRKQHEKPQNDAPGQARTR